MWEGPRGHSQLSRGRDSVAGRHGPRHSGDSGLCALLPGFSRVFGQGSQGIAGLIRSLRPNGVSAVDSFRDSLERRREVRGALPRIQACSSHGLCRDLPGGHPASLCGVRSSRRGWWLRFTGELFSSELLASGWCRSGISACLGP